MGDIDFIEKTSFLAPTTKLKELSLLQHMEENPDTTQKKMAAAIDVAPSMVNVYLNDYEKKDYIVREYISARTVRYLVTPKGLKRKNYLLITYLHELLKLYKLAEENVEGFLGHLEDQGYRRILLYGAGEVAETILGIVKGREDGELEVVGVIDDEEDKRGKELLGFRIVAREDIQKYEHDVVVISSYTFEDEMIRKLAEIEYPKNRMVRFFSG
ncbi:MAG TPA: winged helix-turn-helix transcriptional regulator [Epulopiscium sp.]|nr:winged helix-turn-helix transcriptional regulator [Candidatus Epulonipiscium sp.]